MKKLIRFKNEKGEIEEISEKAFKKRYGGSTIVCPKCLSPIFGVFTPNKYGQEKCPVCKRVIGHMNFSIKQIPEETLKRLKLQKVYYCDDCRDYTMRYHGNLKKDENRTFEIYRCRCGRVTFDTGTTLYHFREESQNQEKRK